MAKRKGLNSHQKAAFRSGEQRVRGEEIDRLIALAASPHAEERLEAAQHLCPCHVRRRIDEAWQALYRMMEDPDVRVRRAAWHTLEDGGCPNDPALAPIFARAAARETDSQVRHFVDLFAAPFLAEQSLIQAQKAAFDPFQDRGKCDFCGQSRLPVRRDFETEIPLPGGMVRFGLICRSCAGERIGE